MRILLAILLVTLQLPTSATADIYDKCMKIISRSKTIDLDTLYWLEGHADRGQYQIWIRSPDTPDVLKAEKFTWMEEGRPQAFRSLVGKTIFIRTQNFGSSLEVTPREGLFRKHSMIMLDTIKRSNRDDTTLDYMISTALGPRNAEMPVLADPGFKTETYNGNPASIGRVTQHSDQQITIQLADGTTQTYPSISKRKTVDNDGHPLEVLIQQGYLLNLLRRFEYIDQPEYYQGAFVQVDLFMHDEKGDETGFSTQNFGRGTVVDSTPTSITIESLRGKRATIEVPKSPASYLRVEVLLPAPGRSKTSLQQF